jgi:hypothetical protein
VAEEAKELQGIDWRRCFSFLEILRSFRLAIHPVKILLCFLGIAASLGVAVGVDQLPAPVGQTDVRMNSASTLNFDIGALRLGFDVGNQRTSFMDNVHGIVTRTLWGRWSLPPYVGGRSWDEFAGFVMAPVSAARESIELIIQYWKQCWLFALINTILSLAIWAVIGTAVSRMAAVRIAREEGVSMSRALAFAIKKWPSAVVSPLLPFGVLVALAALMGVVAGLPLNIPYAGEVVIGLAWILVLAIGFLLAMVFIGGTFSVGLQWPAIAVEGRDSFDAISRSISYISSRPWRYLFYLAFSAVYGCLTFVLVKLVAFLTLYIAHAGVGMFAFAWGNNTATPKLERLWATPTLDAPWPHPGLSDLSGQGAEGLATYAFQFWVWVVLGLAVAFLFSFFFTSQTVIYFLLRKSVEAREIEEVHMEESEEETLPLKLQVEIAKAAAPAGAAKPDADEEDDKEEGT